jgi:hypothetical protein
MDSRPIGANDFLYQICKSIASIRSNLVHRQIGWLVDRHYTLMLPNWQKPPIDIGFLLIGVPVANPISKTKTIGARNRFVIHKDLAIG